MSGRLITLECPSCRATLDVCAHEARFACRYCGAEMMVQSRGGIVSLTSVKGAPASSTTRVVSVATALSLAKKKADAYTEDYLRNCRFQNLSADIDNESCARIGNAVADAYAGGGCYGDAVKAVEKTIDGMTQSRVDMIVRTVLNGAYNSAMLDSAKEPGSGYSLKTWRPDGDCCTEICQPNADAGPIPLDEPFPSGHHAPTGHLGCDCSIAFVKAKK